MTSKEAKEIRDKYYFDLGIYRLYNRNRKLFHTTLKVLFGIVGVFSVVALIADPQGINKFIWPAVYASVGFIAVIALGAVDHFVFVGSSKSTIMRKINTLPWGSPHYISWEKFCDLAEIR
jgi:hypothetical protein